MLRDPNNGHGAITRLAIVEGNSGAVFALVAANKGLGDGYAASVVRQWVDTLGHCRDVLQAGNENATRALANCIKKQAECDIVSRTLPPYSPAMLVNGGEPTRSSPASSAASRKTWRASWAREYPSVRRGFHGWSGTGRGAGRYFTREATDTWRTADSTAPTRVASCSTSKRRS